MTGPQAALATVGAALLALCVNAIWFEPAQKIACLKIQNGFCSLVPVDTPASAFYTAPIGR